MLQPTLSSLGGIAKRLLTLLDWLSGGGPRKMEDTLIRMDVRLANVYTRLEQLERRIDSLLAQPRGRSEAL